MTDTSPAGLQRVAAPAVAPSRLGAIMERQVPSLLQLAGDLLRQVQGARVAALEPVLKAHLHAACALRFELLVSPGLRAGPRSRDLLAFRQQVADVSDCTEATWASIRQFLENDAGRVGQAEALAAEFSVELRSVLRRVGQQAESSAALQRQLEERVPVLTGAQAALREFMARQEQTLEELRGLQQLCDTARPVQGAAFQHVDAQGALRDALRKLAPQLAGGLLARLRVLVEREGGAAADELMAAQQARAELQAALVELLSELVTARARAQDATVWLEAVLRQGAALRQP